MNGHNGRNSADFAQGGGTKVDKASNMNKDHVVLQMKDIVKKFGDFTANDHINLTVHKGEVHAILAQNGAGTRTPMSVRHVSANIRYHFLRR